jgi:hypothetical protein
LPPPPLRTRSPDLAKDGERYARENKALFFECSALSGINVDDMFRAIGPPPPLSLSPSRPSHAAAEKVPRNQLVVERLTLSEPSKKKESKKCC